MKPSLKNNTALGQFGMAFGALALLASPTTALAQIDEVITTAQRASENLQEVPVSVTSLSTEELENRQVQDILDLQYLVPNINIGTNTGTSNAARIFLRGVGEDESRGAVDPAVGIYIDGVFIGKSVGALFDIVDLEQIEVLRGPQGTLYGRSTNGGAIKLTSVKPQDEFLASVKGTYGNYDRVDTKAMLNVPVTDSTSVRLSGLYRSRDGFHTLNPNGDRAEFAGTNIGIQDMFSLRGQLSQDFGSNWNLLLAADYTKDDSDPVPDTVAPPNDRDNDQFTIEPLPGTTCSNLTPATFQPLGCFVNYDSESISQGLSATLTGSFANFDLSSITSYRELDDDLSSRIGFPYFQETNAQQFSQEVTASSNFSGPFNFVTGVFVYEENTKLDATFVVPTSLITDTSSIGVFGQGNYDVTDRLTLTAGVRYTDENKTYEGINRAGGFGRTDDADFNNVSYTLKADYQITDDFLGYVSYATGFKSGGWSADCFSPGAACFRPVDEEKVGTFEAGIKSQIWNDRLRFNATYFNNQYDNLQIGATTSIGFTRFNVDETEIQGLEFELAFRPTQDFQLNANLGFLDAEYQSATPFQVSGLTNNGASCQNGIPTLDCALGLELKNAANYKANIGAVYTKSAFGGDVTLSGDVGFEGKSWSLVANNPPHTEISPPTIANARIAYRPDNGNWNIALWGKNLTDANYYRAAAANQLTAYAADPITYGVDVGFDF
ncbi:TonB-dependent receptor [Litorimonas haliclonae]|uniref:TonB-dependent receptor n=1 Tax=Litorimonas haliclonae TaxID=2081977 RepID=UPI0039EDF707